MVERRKLRMDQHCSYSSTLLDNVEIRKLSNIENTGKNVAKKLKCCPEHSVVLDFPKT
jgi:hypothetical protein